MNDRPTPQPRPVATRALSPLGSALLLACNINVDLGQLSATHSGTDTANDTSGTTSTSGDTGDATGTTPPCDAGVATGDTTYPTSCNALKVACPGVASADYTIDPDGDGAIDPLVVHCEMETDDCGYTMVRFDDPALGSKQDVYGEKCAAVGMEVIVPRTPEMAEAIYVWNNFVVANLYNVFPNFEGATDLRNNWHAVCQGQPCTFWMTDDALGNVACGGYEPNGSNLVGGRIYRWNDGCTFQGGWNDGYDLVQYTGWVICSTNDC